MNNYNYPPLPTAFSSNNFFFNPIEEINRLKEKIAHLEEKVSKIEQEKTNNYLKKDDNYYMI